MTSCKSALIVRNFRTLTVWQIHPTQFSICRHVSLHYRPRAKTFDPRRTGDRYPAVYFFRSLCYGILLSRSPSRSPRSTRIRSVGRATTTPGVGSLWYEFPSVSVWRSGLR